MDPDLAKKLAKQRQHVEDSEGGDHLHRTSPPEKSSHFKNHPTSPASVAEALREALDRPVCEGSGGTPLNKPPRRAQASLPEPRDVSLSPKEEVSVTTKAWFSGPYGELSATEIPDNDNSAAAPPPAPPPPALPAPAAAAPAPPALAAGGMLGAVAPPAEHAGVGMTLSDSYPFTVHGLRPGGPAHKDGKICVGHALLRVNELPLLHSMSGAQVAAMVIGPVNSVVSLQFQDSESGVYTTKLVRQNTFSEDEAHTLHADTQATAATAATHGAQVAAAGFYNDDFDLIHSAEQAIKHHYDPRTKQWARTLINVVVDKDSFAEGTLRTAYMMKDLSATGDSRYVLKMSKDPNENTQQYFDDVLTQMEAKMFAESYNSFRYSSSLRPHTLAA